MKGYRLFSRKYLVQHNLKLFSRESRSLSIWFIEFFSKLLFATTKIQLTRLSNIATLQFAPHFSIEKNVSGKWFYYFLVLHNNNNHGIALVLNNFPTNAGDNNCNWYTLLVSIVSESLWKSYIFKSAN